MPNSEAAPRAPFVLPSESELQLLYARLNLAHFAGELSAYRIVFNPRLASVAGRISYRPPVIELSTGLLATSPEQIESTLLHEMIHAWLRARRLPSGHGPAFKRKMREVGLASIYHSMPVRRRVSPNRYVLSCPRCRIELLRRRVPAVPVSCARCCPRRYDARVRMRVRRIEPGPDR